MSLGLLGASLALGGAAAVSSQVGKLIDIKNAPNQLKSLGNYNISVLANGTIPFVETYYIDDYKEVADTYEKTGYRVDLVLNTEYHKTLPHLIDDQSLFTRYYFNPLQFGNVDLDCNINISGAMLSDFSFRLKNGIRFWKVASDVEIGNYQNDNVEVKYL